MEGRNVCPRCGGAIFVDRDYLDGEWFEYCLQCSYRHYLPEFEKSSTSKETTRKRKKRRKKQSVKNEKRSIQDDTWKSKCTR